MTYFYQTEIKMCKALSSMSLDNGSREIVPCPLTFFEIAWRPITAHHPCHCSACEAASNGRSEHLGHPRPFLTHYIYIYKCLCLLDPLVVKCLVQQGQKKSLAINFLFSVSGVWGGVGKWWCEHVLWQTAKAFFSIDVFFHSEIRFWSSSRALQYHVFKASACIYVTSWAATAVHVNCTLSERSKAHSWQ